VNILDTLPSYREYLGMERQLRPETIRAYIRDLRGLHKFTDGADVTVITRDDLRRHMRHMNSEGRARATIRRTMQSFGTYFKWLKYESHRADVATDGLIIPKRKNVQAVYLTEDQLRVFAETYPPMYKNAIPERDRAAWRLLAFLGLRRGEILGLRIEDVRFDTQQIILRDTKDGHDAALPMPDAIVNDLAAAVGRRTEGWLCPAWEGGQWKGSNFSVSFHHHLKACGLDGLGITAKALRHSFGTYLSLSGVQLPVIQDLMRHKEIKTTRKYIHLHPDTMKAALKKLPIAKDKAG
jgi:integrase/recombinase XerD